MGTVKESKHQGVKNNIVKVLIDNLIFYEKTSIELGINGHRPVWQKITSKHYNNINKLFFNKID